MDSRAANNQASIESAAPYWDLAARVRSIWPVGAHGRVPGHGGLRWGRELHARNSTKSVVTPSELPPAPRNRVVGRIKGRGVDDLTPDPVDFATVRRGEVQPYGLESWLTNVGDTIVRKAAASGVESLTTRERLIYELWRFDTEQRNGGVAILLQLGTEEKIGTEEKNRDGRLFQRRKK